MHLRFARIGTAPAGAAGLVWTLGVRDLPAAARTAFPVGFLGLPFGVPARVDLEILSSSTTRVCARETAILIDRRDGAELDRMARRRLLPLPALFLGNVVFLSGPILAVFRPDFVDEGVRALRILAPSAAFTMLFALAPTVLEHRAGDRAPLGLVAAEAILQVVTLLLLVPRLCATGAAPAGALSALVLCGGSAHLARRAISEPARHVRTGVTDLSSGLMRSG